MSTPEHVESQPPPPFWCRPGRTYVAGPGYRRVADNSCTASEAFPLHAYACPSVDLPAILVATAMVEGAQTLDPQGHARGAQQPDVEEAVDKREGAEEKGGSDEQDGPPSAAQAPALAVPDAPEPVVDAPSAAPAVEPLQPTDATVKSEPQVEPHEASPVPVAPPTVSDSALGAAPGMPQALASAGSASTADSNNRADSPSAASAVVADVDAARDYLDKSTSLLHLAAVPVHAPGASAADGELVAHAEAGGGAVLYGPLISGTLLPAPLSWGWLCLMSMPPLAALAAVLLVYRRHCAGSLRLCAAADKMDAASSSGAGSSPQDDADGATAPRKGLHKGGRRKRTVAECRSQAAADAASELHASAPP